MFLWVCLSTETGFWAAFRATGWLLGGRDLCVHLLQAPVKQGHPEQDIQGHILVAFENLQEDDSTASQGNETADGPGTQVL